MACWRKGPDCHSVPASPPHWAPSAAVSSLQPRARVPGQWGSQGSSPGWSSTRHPRCPQRVSTWGRCHLQRAGTPAVAAVVAAVAAAGTGRTGALGGRQRRLSSSPRRPPVSVGSSPELKAALRVERRLCPLGLAFRPGSPQGGKQCSGPPGPPGCAGRPWRRRVGSGGCRRSRPRGWWAWGRRGNCSGTPGAHHLAWAGAACQGCASRCPKGVKRLPLGKWLAAVLHCKQAAPSSLPGLAMLLVYKSEGKREKAFFLLLLQVSSKVSSPTGLEKILAQQ